MTIAASLPTTLSSRQAASSPSAGWKLLAAAAALSASSRQACAFVPSGGRWSATSPGSSVLSRGNGATVDTTLRFACPAAPKSTAAAAAAAAVTAPVGITRRSARVVGERAAGASCRALMSSSIPGGYESSRGLVFPTDKEEGWFDTASVGSPRVHRYLHDEGSRWVMWYHGQDTAWSEEGEGVMDIGTGRIGRAESSDGLTWRRTPGQMPLMSVMDKNTEQWWGFDTAHVGLGDVNLGASSRVVTESSVYFMYYFGGDYEETDVEAEFGMSNPSTTGGGGGGNAPPKGVRLRIGVALSQDGVNWCRIEGEHPTGACIDVGGDGEWDRLFVGWPVVINHREKEFRMYYHSLDPDTKKFTVGMATSQDGMAWQKRGPVFDGGPEGAFDEAGAGRRRVVMLHGVYHMIYEGVNKEGVHALGLATSADGVEWERVGGKPIFERSPSSSGAWDAGGVSNPEIVEIENGDWYLYYTGQSERGAVEKQGGIATSAIGVAMATGDDFTSWTRVEA